MEQILKCPEEGCKTKVSVWTGSYLITEDQRNCDRACPKHRAKYLKLKEDHERFVEMVNRHG